MLKDLDRWDFHHYLTLLISQESKQKPRGRFGLLTLDMLEITFYGINTTEIDSITAALRRKIYLGSHTKHIVNITNLDSLRGNDSIQAAGESGNVFRHKNFAVIVLLV